MKLAFVAAAAATLFAAAPAFAAGPVSTDVTINGTVPSQCGIGNQSGGGTRGGPAVVAITNLTDGNGFLSVPPQEIAFDNVWCNNASSVTMTVTRLSTGTVVLDTSSFVNTLEMVVGNNANALVLPTYFNVPTLSSGAVPGSVTNAIPAAFETGTGKYSKASLQITLPTGTVGNDRPVAGSYTGTVTFTATPN